MSDSLEASDLTDSRWLVYPGDADTEPGRGRRIVFVAGDEEYRSEEVMPMLARLMNSHGFETVVLFSQDADTGVINPDNRTNIPGTHLVENADLLVLQLRFRELPDEAMKPIVDHVNAGKPLTGIRTSTHAFNYAGDSPSTYRSWSWNSADPGGGFGREVLGETWVAHHGHHGREATRGIRDQAARKHPVLNGVDDVFGPTDVYAIRDLPDDATVLLRGAILEGMSPDDCVVADHRNAPMHPVAWLRERPMPDGTTQRIFVSTIGAADDFSSEDLRRLLANAAMWQLDEHAAIPKEGLAAPVIGRWDPTPFGFGTYRKDVTPAQVRDGWPDRQ